MPFSSIYIAGHRGLVGGAMVRYFETRGQPNIIVRSKQGLDLRDSDAVREFFSSTRPEAVVMAAAKVGGIQANNNFPVEFLLENLRIQNNVIAASFEAGVKKLLFLGSSCIYPRLARQPIREDSLLSGPLEPTNKPYAIAKIAGIELCQAYSREYGANFISAMPTNLYGPGDNYHPQDSHVPAALISRFHAAKLAGEPHVSVWGTGAPRREFLAVDDLADACVFLMQHYSDAGFVNIGSGEEITIADFARLVAEVVGYQGRIIFDTSRPDGMPRKRLDISKLTALGWRPKTALRDGLRQTYADFLARNAPRGLRSNRSADFETDIAVTG